MDGTTIIFILVLLVAFVFLRWFVNSEEEPDFHVPHRNATAHNTVAPQPTQRGPPRRHITTDMVEVVQQLAPHVSEAQIRHDLLRSGSVEATVERILAEGTLPQPPVRNATNTRVGAGSASSEPRNQSKIQPENLLKKYGIDEKAAGAASSASAASGSKKMEWSTSAEQRGKTLQEKKAEMILKARKRLEAQLSNQQDLSALANK